MMNAVIFGNWNGGLRLCKPWRRCLPSSLTASLQLSSKLLVGNNHHSRLKGTNAKQCYVLARSASTTSIVQSKEANAQVATPNKALNDHQPPLPIRIALVCTTTALSTPSFPALGFLYTVMRFTVPDANLRKAMEGRWGTLLSFATWTLLPKLYHGTVASLILPCAMGNAIVAGGVYGIIDLACGGPAGKNEQMKKLLETPWIMGSGVGATVGYVAPNYVYGPVMEHIYRLEGMSQSVQCLMSSVPFATEVSVVTGAVAGMILHPLLYYPMNGIPGMHWCYFSGMTLALASSALYYVYYGRDDVGLPVPTGSFIDATELELVESVLRYNPASGDVEAYSLRTDRFVGSREKYMEGKQILDAAISYSKSGNAVFDDRLLAFVYNYWDVNMKSRYPDHVLDLISTSTLQHRQEAIAITDASVAVLLNQNTKCSKHRLKSAEQSGLSLVLEKIDGLHHYSKTGWKQSVTMDSLEEVGVALELLMTLRQTAGSENRVGIDPNFVLDLERFIRKRFPCISLYKSDEEYKKVSVESQLQATNWKGPDLAVALDRWERLCQEETSRIRKRIGVSVAVGALLFVASSLIR